ncbi:nuclear envelope phosphatase-regulatory subunit 1 [Exaiptasia diaphana]|uniref:Transmembrane protein 188 n=1 Tax=Exaiptasia diaphana TaxID=2652724 RepID=A0A913WRJ3_EXADI|nr:nuclear envelope phosphatase-regulatory subunit 1 [Exaiptasia diaphana]KXJ18490.1 Nuclear envelope phosphatase-regulatory subunit 1 [Exaiptasia diaphana]
MEDFYNQIDVTEDLKAFERRLTEYLTSLSTTTTRWRVILAVSSAVVFLGAWGLIIDDVQHGSFLMSLWYHKLFTLSCFNLLVLILFGIHRRVVAPNIILSRTRLVLQDYNMSCDEKGRLILKARPSSGLDD